MDRIKDFISVAAGAVGSAIAYLFGGWNSATLTLCIFMAVDYLSGLVVAGVFHKSRKSDGGALDSKAGFKGLFKKAFILLVILLAYRLDLLIGSQYIKDMACIAYIVNETLSIIENLGLMGVPVPNVIKKAIDLLNKKTDGGDKNE